MLKHIRLELARDADFPEGSAQHGYDFVAPLNAEGSIDLEGFMAAREHCRVLRFWGDAEHEKGHLVRLGSDAWAFHYQKAGDVDVADEEGYRFQTHFFRTGEYVSIRDPDGEMRTFRVISVKDIQVAA
jgi:hypothetical protein